MSTNTKTQRFAAAVKRTNTPTTSRLVAALGAALIYIPFGMWMTQNYLPFAIAGAVITLGVSMVPDKLTWRFIPHGWTHSPLGGAAVGTALAGVGWWVASNVVVHAGGAVVVPLAAAKYGFAVGALGAYGHVLGDFLTGTDVRPLFPIVNRELSINVPRLLDPRDNEGVNFIGTMAVVAIAIALLSSGVTAATIP